METKVLTQEEITQLKDLQDKRKSLSGQFGLLEINYETQKQSLLYQLNQLLQEEDKIIIIDLVKEIEVVHEKAEGKLA